MSINKKKDKHNKLFNSEHFRNNNIKNININNIKFNNKFEFEEIDNDNDYYNYNYNDKEKDKIKNPNFLITGRNSKHISLKTYSDNLFDSKYNKKIYNNVTKKEKDFIKINIKKSIEKERLHTINDNCNYPNTPNNAKINLNKINNFNIMKNDNEYNFKIKDSTEKNKDYLNYDRDYVMTYAATTNNFNIFNNIKKKSERKNQIINTNLHKVKYPMIFQQVINEFLNERDGEDKYKLYKSKLNPITNNDNKFKR
jgi:hypothetical protein